MVARRKFDARVEIVEAIDKMTPKYGIHFRERRDAEQLIALANNDWRTVCNQFFFDIYDDYVEKNNYPNIVKFIRNYGPNIVRLCDMHFPMRHMYFKFMQ